LAAHLVWNFSNPKVKAAEYYYFNQKYKISEVDGELPICLFSTGYNIFSKNEFDRYFQSIEQQNYENYKVILIDDFSPDNSAHQLYNYLQLKNYRLKNRIQIVHNQQRVGALANIYYYMRTLCN
jgi:hypothetical protein